VKIFPLAIAILAGLGASQQRAVHADDVTPPIRCTKPGICQLHGDVQIVKSFGKYKVKVVTSFPDIRVKKVGSLPTSPGEWKFVDSLGDFTVQFVDSFPDFTIQYVDSFPGCD
jgi:hypothetical protein